MRCFVSLRLTYARALLACISRKSLAALALRETRPKTGFDRKRLLRAASPKESSIG